MSGTMLGVVEKAPGDELDWDVIFSRWLPAGDILVEASCTAVIGAGTTATVDHIDVSADTIKVWLEGGAAEDSAIVTVTGVTSGGRTKVVRFRLEIEE